MKRSLLINPMIRASTIIEMLIVMIISGIVIGLTFDGVDIFRRYSRKVTNEIVSSNDLLNSYLSLNEIVGRSDSLTLNNDMVLFHRKGSVFGELYIEDYDLHIRLLNTTDTLPMKVESLEARLGVISDTLIVKTEAITLIVNTKEQVVISTKKNNYDQDQSN